MCRCGKGLSRGLVIGPAAAGFLRRFYVFLLASISCSVVCGLMMPSVALSREIQVFTTYLAFSPDSIEAKVGDRITWINNGGVLHEIYFPVNPTNAEGRHLHYVLSANKAISIIVSKPGDYDYFCRWHGMRGSIHVTGRPSR